MMITDNRIQSALRTYSNQLRRSRLSGKTSGENAQPTGEKVTISEEARRQSIVQQVTYQALEQVYSSQNDDADVEDQEAGPAPR